MKLNTNMSYLNDNNLQMAEAELHQIWTVCHSYLNLVEPKILPEWQNPILLKLVETKNIPELAE